MKQKRNLLKILLIIAIVLTTVLLSFKPVFNRLTFGLDLKGGFEILYEVSSVDGEPLTKNMVNNTYRVLMKRIDTLGVAEPNLTIEGDYNFIRVQLAGTTREEAGELGRPFTLTFRDTNDNLLMTSQILKAGGASRAQDKTGRPAVALAIRDNDKFYEVTNRIKDYPDNRIVIWLDFEEGIDSFQKEQYNCGELDDLKGSKCLSAASVQEAFAGDVIIQGNFTLASAGKLAQAINDGSLPTKLKEISAMTVSPEFGEETLNKTGVAAVIGVLLVILFMIIIYRVAGVMAGIGILIYTALVFLIFNIIGGVLTLPGIAALALGIGMAVDAGVITFERIKEELKAGRSLEGAFNMGNELSFSAILDANVTTLIVAIILYIFGEFSVKGFATMLIINITVTMAIIVFLLRFGLKLIINTKYFDDLPNLFIGLKKTAISNVTKGEAPKEPFSRLNFVRYYRLFLMIPLIIIIIGWISTIGVGLNLGIDYQSGSNVKILTNNTLKVPQITADFQQLDYPVKAINKYSEGIMITTPNILNDKDTAQLETYFKDKYGVSVETSVVSAKAKEELVSNAKKSIIYAYLMVIIYLTVRYTFTYAIAAIIALIHDVLIVVSIFSIARLEISTMFIAAILTIIGYSINDTVVIFDRIKENIKLKFNNKLTKKEDLVTVVNISLRQTLIRSIYTTVTTLLPVISLLLFGTYVIFNFNLALLIGLIVGTYSSMFIASQIWLILEMRKLTKGYLGPKKWFTNLKDELDEVEVKGINK
ncbi:MAG: protein translocase subunit SecF [Bacilli bacterium]|nr:protein translocase subunit SecF [Bacilli bacterium]